MGTNFYFEKTCEHCGSEQRLHIGKSSSGWKFLFAPYRKAGITSWSAWRDFMQANEGIIVDEYGAVRSLVDFVRIVEVKQHDCKASTGGEKLDDEGYRICNTWDFS